MTSHVNARFRSHFAHLPKRIQEQARRAYRLFKADPSHPGLEFKKLPPYPDIWSVRITDDYRTIGQSRRAGNSIVWFFIAPTPNTMRCWRGCDPYAWPPYPTAPPSSPGTGGRRAG